MSEWTTVGTENNTNYHIAWKDIVVSATECSDYMCRFQNEINKINPLKMNQNMNLSTNKLKSYHKKKTNVQNFTPNQWNGFIVNFLEKLFEVEALSSHKNVKSAKSKSSAGSVSLEDAQKIITCVLQIHDCFHFNVTMYQKVICAVRTLLNIEALESRSILSLNDFLGKDKSSADRVGGLAAGVASQLTQEDCLSIFYIVYSYSLLCIDLLKSYQFVANGVESEPESGGRDSGDSDGSNSDSSSDDDLLFWQRGKTVPAPQQTPRKMRQANRKGGQAQPSRSGSELERDTECADKPINMKMCLELLDHLVLALSLLRFLWLAHSEVMSQHRSPLGSSQSRPRSIAKIVSLARHKLEIIDMLANILQSVFLVVHKYAGNTTGGNGSEIVDLNSGLWVSNTMNALISKWNSESGVKSNTELESPSSWLAVPPSGMSSTPNCRLFHNLMKILQISADICGHYTVTDERLSAQWKCIGLHSKLQGKLFGDGSDACVQSMDVMVNTVGEPGGRHSLIRTSLRRKYLSSPTPSSSNSSSSRCKETAPQSKTSSEHPARLWAPYCETWSSISPVNRLYIHIGIPLLRLGLQKHQQLNGNCLGSGAIGSSASKEKPQLHGHFRTLVYYASKFLTGLYVCQSENRLQAATAADVALAHTGGKGKNRTTATAVLEDSESAADGNGGDGGDHSGLKLKMKSKTISNAAASGSFPIDPFGLMMQAQTVLQALYVVLMQTNREMNAKVPNAKMGTGSGTSVWCPCLRVVNPDGLVSPCETQKAIVWNVILGLISGICQYKPSSFHQYWNLVYMRDGSLIDSKLTKYVDFLISTKVCSKGGNKDYFVGKPQFVSVFYANAAPLPSQFQSGDMAGIQESAILCLISTVKGNRDLKNLLHKALLSVDTLHWTPLVEQLTSSLLKMLKFILYCLMCEQVEVAENLFDLIYELVSILPLATTTRMHNRTKNDQSICCKPETGAPLANCSANEKAKYYRDALNYYLSNLYKHLLQRSMAETGKPSERDVDKEKIVLLLNRICLNYPQHDAMHEALTRASMNRLDSLPLYQAQPCSDYVYFVLDAVCSDGDPHNSMLNSTLLSFLKTLASRYANVWSYPTAASNSSDKWLLNRTRIYLYASGLVGETTVAIRSVVLTLFGSLLQSVPESDIGKDMMIDGGDVGLGLNLVDMASILVHLYVQHSGVETYDHQIRLLILNVLGSIRAQHWKCLSLPGPAGDTALQSVLKIDWNQCKNVSTGTGRGHLGCPTVAAVLFSILLHCGTLDVVGTVRAGAHKILGELLLILPLRESSLLCQQVVDSARIRPMLTSNTPIGQSVVAKITGAKDSLMWLETMGDCMDRVTEEYMHRVELDEKSVHILTECLCHIVRVILSGCCDNKVLVRMNSYWSLGNCLQLYGSELHDACCACAVDCDGKVSWKRLLVDHCLSTLKHDSDKCILSVVRCLGLLMYRLTPQRVDELSVRGSDNSEDCVLFTKVWNEVLCRLLSVSSATGAGGSKKAERELNRTGTDTSIMQLTADDTTNANYINSKGTAADCGAGLDGSPSILSVSNVRSTMQYILTNKLPIKIIVSYTYTAGLLVVPICQIMESRFQSESTIPSVPMTGSYNPSFTVNIGNDFVNLVGIFMYLFEFGTRQVQILATVALNRLICNLSRCLLLYTELKPEAKSQNAELLKVITEGCGAYTLILLEKCIEKLLALHRMSSRRGIDANRNNLQYSNNNGRNSSSTKLGNVTNAAAEMESASAGTDASVGYGLVLVSKQFTSKVYLYQCTVLLHSLLQLATQVGAYDTSTRSLSTPPCVEGHGAQNSMLEMVVNPSRSILTYHADDIATFLEELHDAVAAGNESGQNETTAPIHGAVNAQDDTDYFKLFTYANVNGISGDACISSNLYTNTHAIPVLYHICRIAHFMMEICSIGAPVAAVNSTDALVKAPSASVSQDLQSCCEAYTEVTFHKLLWLVASGSVTSTAVPSVDNEGERVDIDASLEPMLPFGDDDDEI